MSIMPFVKVYPDMLNEIQSFSMTERGRILTLMLEYLNDGQLETSMSGNERFYFPVVMGRMDRDAEQYAKMCERNRTNGAMGGRPRQENPVGFSETQANPVGYSGFPENPNKDKDKDKDKDGGFMLAADDAPLDLNSLPAYASSNLQFLSPRNMEELLSFTGDLPDELIRYAIDQGCAAGKRTWAYVRAILNAYVSKGIKTVGDAKAKDDAHAQGAKQAQAARQNPALNYPQRDYKPEDFGDNFFFDPLKAGYGGDG